MGDLKFTWDHHKARANLRKHRVSFEEACSAFGDENARVKHDPEHSESEDRYVVLGLSSRLRLLVVCHAYDEEEMKIRIISARKAVPRERQQYGEWL